MIELVAILAFTFALVIAITTMFAVVVTVAIATAIAIVMTVVIATMVAVVPVFVLATMFAVVVTRILLFGLITSAGIAVVATTKIAKIPAIEVATTRGVRTPVTVSWVKLTINASVKVATAIPLTSADEVASLKPVRPVVAIWSATVGRIAVVPVSADGRASKVDANRNLSVRSLNCAEQDRCECCN